MDALRGTMSWFATLRLMAADNRVQVVVKGHCMAPLVADGARVEVTGPAAIYWPGDVVVLLIAGRGLTIHRVIGSYRRAGRWRYLTQADSAERPDPPVFPELILGRVLGGECALAVVKVPLRHRLHAVVRFLRVVLRVLARRTIGWSWSLRRAASDRPECG